MSNGNGKERRLDSGLLWMSTFGVRNAGSKAPLFQEGKIYLSPGVAAAALAGAPVYVSGFGTGDFREDWEAAQAAGIMMRGGVSLQFSASPYRRDDEDEEARFKRIIVDLYDKPTPSDVDEARLGAALGYVGKSDAPWLKEFAEGTVERRNSS